MTTINKFINLFYVLNFFKIILFYSYFYKNNKLLSKKNNQLTKYDNTNKWILYSLIYINFNLFIFILQRNYCRIKN